MLCLHLAQWDNLSVILNQHEQHITCHYGSMWDSLIHWRELSAMSVHIADDYISHFSQAEYKWPKQVRGSCSCNGHCSSTSFYVKSGLTPSAAHFQTDGHAHLFVFPFLRCQWDTGCICVHKQLSMLHQCTRHQWHKQLLPCQMCTSW